MSGAHNPAGVPYVLASDPLVDYPPLSAELADWIANHRGHELANVSAAGDVGPTGVTAGGDGDALYDLGTLTTRAVPHWWESSLLVRSSVANDPLFLLLYEGSPAAPGPNVAYAALYAPAVGGLLASVRLRFTPAAGSRGYHVRWRNQGGAGTVWTILNSLYQGNHSIREATT